jgi:hypothetical protein
MSGKQGYQPIPDVESGADVKFSTSTRVMYPEATHQEADLLETIDGCINGPRFDLILPKVSPEDVLSSSPNLCCAMVMPLLGTVCLLAMAGYIGTGATSKVVDPELTDSYFPYVAAVVLWIFSAFPINWRMMGQAKFAIEYFSAVDENLESSIDNFSISVSDKIGIVNKKLIPVVRNMKRKLELAEKMMPELTKIEQSLDFSDPSDTTKELVGAPEEIYASAESLKRALSARALLPGSIRSKSSHCWRSVLPVLLACLALQLFSMFFFTVYVQGIVLYLHGFTSSNSVRYLRGIADESFRSDSVDFNPDELLEQASSVVEETQELVVQTLPYVLVVLESFVIAFFQIGVVYIFTGNTSVAEMVNRASDRISESTDEVAREHGLEAVTEAVLGGKMSRIKTRILNTIELLKRIEVAKGKIAASPKKEIDATMTTPSPRKKGLGRLFNSGKK